MKFFIKICGITSEKDAEMVSSAGVDAVGLNFWPGSRRYVSEERAPDILAAVRPGIIRVGVFANAHPLVVRETMAELGLDRVQLHGNEKVGDFGGIPVSSIIKVIRVDDESSLREAFAWDAGLFLYDARVEGYGGQGVVAPWEIIARGARRPFLLAGGLTPDNVGEALTLVRPTGVDVASGVELEPGVKDPERVEAFVSAVHRAALDITDPG